MNFAEATCIILLQALLSSGYFNWVSNPENVPLYKGKSAILKWVYETNESISSLSWQKEPQNEPIVIYSPSQNVTIFGKGYDKRVKYFYQNTKAGIILSDIIASDHGNYSCLVTTTSTYNRVGTTRYSENIPSSSFPNPDDRHIYSLQVMLILLCYLLQ